MKFKEKLSSELKDILLACTTKQQRKEIATQNGVSKHTLMAIMRGDRFVNENNQKCIIELLKVAVSNAKNMDKTLMDYFVHLSVQ